MYRIKEQTPEKKSRSHGCLMVLEKTSSLVKSALEVAQVEMRWINAITKLEVYTIRLLLRLAQDIRTDLGCFLRTFHSLSRTSSAPRPERSDLTLHIMKRTVVALFSASTGFVRWDGIIFRTIWRASLEMFSKNLCTSINNWFQAL